MQLVLSGRIQVPPCWLSGPAGPHLDLGMQAPSLVLANSGMQTLPMQPLHQLSHQNCQEIQPLSSGHLTILELRNDVFTRAPMIEDQVNGFPFSRGSQFSVGG